MSSAPAIAYFNGRFLPLTEVHVSPLDRGFLFADGLYEVVPVYRGCFLRLDDHLDRLEQGLAALKLDSGLSRPALTQVLSELVLRNGGGQLAVYLQITRGAPAKRNHDFPQPPVTPTVLAMATPFTNPAALYQTGWRAVTVADIRWGACHLKTIALLANVLARQQAVEQEADDAILVRDGLLTECAAGNVYLVRDGVVHTPLKDQRILPGITRAIVLELLTAAGIPWQERDIPVAELADAAEVWVSSSTKEIVPITHIDKHPVGTGTPGPVWARVWELYQAYKTQLCPPLP